MPSIDDNGDPAGSLNALRDEIRSAVKDYLCADPDPGATGRGPEVEKRAWVRSEPGLAPELRSERQFVRVKLPMEVEHRGTVYRGFDVSLGGFSVVGNPAVDDDVAEDFVIRLLFRGYALTVSVRAIPVRQVEQGNLSGFRIVEIEDDQLEALRKILRAYLSGQLVTLEGLLVAADSQTTRSAQAAAAAERRRLSGRALWRQRAWYGAITAATLALLMVLAASLFERLAVVEAGFAAVSAPKLEIRAPADGEVGAHRLRPGDRVRRDQLLAEVRDRDLEHELELVRARVAGAQRFLGRPGSSTGQLAAAPWPTLLPGVLADAERRSELEATLGVEQARLTALEHRLESNRLYAPCDCMLFWSAPAGDWVKKGDRLFTLVGTGPSDLLVEALVPLRAVSRIRLHDMAFIELPQTGELIEARVALIALEAERHSRAGFPHWAREDRSVASILLSPSRALPSDMIGVPVGVVFSRAPGVTLMIANLKLRLGDLAPAMLAALGLSGRAVAREGR